MIYTKNALIRKPYIQVKGTGSSGAVAVHVEAKPDIGCHRTRRYTRCVSFNRPRDIVVELNLGKVEPSECKTDSGTRLEAVAQVCKNASCDGGSATSCKDPIPSS